MIHVDLEKLSEFLTAQRWFGGKAWPIKGVELIDHIDLLEAPLDSGCPVLALVEVRYAVGMPERYLAVVSVGPGGTVADALSDDRVACALLDFIRREHARSSASGMLRGEQLASAGHVLRALSAAPRVRRPQAEQTHTSIVFDEKVILKVIRKLELGPSPEYEVGSFLAAHSFRATPALLGALHLEGRAGTTLAVLHEFVPSPGDGWSWLLARLREGASEALIAQAVRTLGERVGELHRALGADPVHPAFAPEPILLEDLQRWSSSIIGEMGVTLAEASRDFPQVRERHHALLERARRLAQLTPSGMKIRIHGDLHLGQVLRSETEGWFIFDFEGEPARKVPQRREKQCPLKDVAGMLRSLDYAGATLALEGRLVGELILRARRELLAGYREAVRDSDLLPREAATFDGMVDAFELEKLLYEIRYELSHRPGWAHIPVQALMRQS